MCVHVSVYLSIASIETSKHTQWQSAAVYTNIVDVLALKLIRENENKNQRVFSKWNWGETGLDLGARPRLRGWTQT